MGKELDIPKPGPLSKIEKAGEQVIEHLIELARTSDLSHNGIAKRINEVYHLDVTRQNVESFFKSNIKITQKYLDNRKSLAVFRAKMTLDHSEQLVMDIKDLNSGIEDLKGEDGSLLEVDKKWKQIGDLIDKKGKLLLRAARLSGRIEDPSKEGGTTIIDKVELTQNINIKEERSEIMRKLKTFEPTKIKEKVVDVEMKEVTAK